MAEEYRRTPDAPVDEAQIKADMHTAFDVYFQVRQELTGRKPDKTPVEHHQNKKSFIAMGTICRERGWKLDSYIRHTFGFVDSNAIAMRPSELVKPEIIKRYSVLLLTDIPGFEPDSEYEALAAQVLVYAGRRKTTATAVLEAPMTPFPSWFRVIYADSPSQKIMDRYSSEAYDEIKEDVRIYAVAEQKGPRAFAALQRSYGRIGV